VNYFASIFPIGADFVRVLRDFQTIANRERGASFFHHLFGFVEGIDGEGDYICVFLLKLIDMRLEIGYLPDAVGSPDAAVKNYHGVFASEIHGNI
jgi:hypothetical protein